MNENIIAFVHAKGTSNRVPSKNMRMLGDKPLFCHAIEIAKQSNLVSKVVVDSDSDEILAIGKKHGAIPLKRPADLATNLATGDDLAYWQASNYPDSDIVIQVIPTAPFLKPASVDGAIQMLLDNMDLDSVAGVYAEAFYQWKNGKPAYYLSDGTIPNSNTMEKIIYETTGMYANHTRAVLKTKKRLNPNNCQPFFVSKIETTDINTLEDFEIAELLWKGMNFHV
ncbi:MAG: acylneuraminate cytidylyltransferase family protein [Clostridiales bacterium]|nr:acylneuraminate cytidylyltransferase family protein [Clostridiales bacterium]